MMQMRSLLKSTIKSITKQPAYSLQQVKNMFEENLKQELQHRNDSKDVVEKYDRLYKPSYTIEFNREGEVLLFSCDPFKHSTVYFKYPYILYESLIPASIWMWFNNPFELSWYWNNVFVFAPQFLWAPRLWYFKDLSFKINRMYLLKGGKVVKLETQTLFGNRNNYYAEIYNFRPLTASFKDFDDRNNSNFLEEEGQLKYELGCQLDHLQELGCCVQDEVIYFMKQGVVHQPELFEAVCKGYHIDTNDFVINTAHNRRAMEGNHNF